MVLRPLMRHHRRTERGIRSEPVNHVDLLEDVILAMAVSLTTVVALYAGWRAGLARRWAPGARDDRVEPELHTEERGPDALRPVGFDGWSQRLAVEQARCARHGSSATVVAIRVD